MPANKVSGCAQDLGFQVDVIYISVAYIYEVMQQLKAGQTFWSKQNSIKLEGTILTEVEYTPNIEELPWHYHESFLFYFHLKGRLDEVSKKKTVNCTAGTLLFHHWQDAHYDKNFSNDANFFHIEIENKWFLKHQVKPNILEGSVQLGNPALKPLFHAKFSHILID